MELYIQIVDGQPTNHPIVEDNFKQAFPDINTSNLPPEFARFVRIARPAIGDFEIYEGVTYAWAGEIVTDVHHVRDMTPEEKQEKLNLIALSKLLE
jgi:hypothetical protein